MSATRLPDGSVVMRPSGQRAVTPKGGGTAVARPAVARGGGSGAGGKAAGVRAPQPGRGAAPKNAYR
jgi:hypothetical protein